ncbi:MAG: glucosamine-6-phosphate deaminase [Pirellulaceae bacterium]|nr:MAG: glucosamine-6-phosphate deaminase [Pirellulaceae bacterium]
MEASPDKLKRKRMEAYRRVPGTRVPTFVFQSGKTLARHVAQLIAQVIRERNALGQNCVLGLPTGSTPIGVYRELIRMYRDGQIDFSRVVTFNLDEYYGLGPDSLQSYHRWMHEHFFRHVNIPPQNIHIPSGLTPVDRLEAYCREYETAIQQAGGIDLMLLGIGTNGHIGFNEPFSQRYSRTRLCTLDPVTRRNAASDFFGEENVPQQAITMGLATILESRKIILMALGEHKAPVIKETCEGPVTPRVPASYLQEHPDAAVYVDAAAGKDLTACATPWLLESVAWDEYWIKRAVLWLCDQTGKALLKLDDDDFRNYNLHQLLRHHGPAEKLAHQVFRWMMNTIEYHPAGRSRKRILCFSPHPDDDVISMGGTLIRLVCDGHEVHIAYMTSGNIAVFDHDARRVADLVVEYNRLFGIDEERSRQVYRAVDEWLARKKPGEPDEEAVQKIKALIRWSEAKAAAAVVGCREDHLHFLDLPFYRTGTVDKKPIGEEDIQILIDLIQQVSPHQIYVAGDLSDPHGTHRLCAEAVFAALERLEGRLSIQPEVLLYRGAWQEYELHEIQIAVPLSPQDIETKRQAIFMHESQKDEALFPGNDPREFWQRAEDRNRATADRFNRIGLPEYYAMEAFVRWDGMPL